MNQNKLIAFLTLLILGFVYLICTFIVWLTKGKNRFFITSKLKTGARILIITGLLSVLSCESCVSPPMCYKPAPVNYFSFQNVNEKYELFIEASGNRILNGIVGAIQAREYYFEITDENKNPVQEGKVQAIDGKLDNDPEEIRIAVSTDLSPGTYVLSIFARESEGNEYLVYINTILIK